MDINPLNLIASSVFTILFLSSALLPTNSQQFSRKLSKEEMGIKRETLSHLHFYFHDIGSGSNPTAVHVAQAATTNSSSSLFGAASVIDDRLTEGPQISSKTVGRAQGMYIFADSTQVALSVLYNFVFTEGKFNGSVLSILGRNPMSSAVRELVIVGGSGVFRFARGYAEARTISMNMQTGDAMVEYNLYVFHH
ncbi:Dirigent protein 21 [Sesamum alatum]|uniref:Dirigent protein n=1 Tax=Sesamum alatum TaxID=300844 RepID=A0AAE1XKE9_9LAMI|nr:Dirigent protein 21 [Sesamum alatum]